MKKIWLYGAGSAAEKFLYNYNEKNIKILGILDKDSNKWGNYIQGYRVQNPSLLKEKNYDEIWITSMFVKEIKEALVSKGVELLKIKPVPKNMICTIGTPYPFENKDTRELAVTTFLEVVQLFNKYEIDYFVYAGTLLGIIRDNDFIPWDSDIDMLIPYGEISKVRDLFLNNKIITYGGEPAQIKERYNSINELICFELIFNINNITVDLNISTFKLEHFIDEKYFATNEKLIFKGVELKVPYDAVGFLNVMYGENWTKPLKDLDFEYSGWRELYKGTDYSSEEYKKHYYVKLK